MFLSLWGGAAVWADAPNIVADPMSRAKERDYDMETLTDAFNKEHDQLSGPQTLALIDRLTRHIARTPHNALLYLDRAIAYQHIMRFRDAINDLTTAVKLKPVAEWYFKRGIIYRTIHEQGKAMEDAHTALKVDAKCGEAWQLIALCYSDQKDLPKACDAFEKYLKTSPNDFNKRQKLAKLYVSAKQYDKAIAAYNINVANRPRNEDAIYGRAQAYELAGQYAKAVTDYTTLLKRDPLDPQELYRRRARCYEGLGRAAEAKADLSRATGGTDSFHL